MMLMSEVVAGQALVIGEELHAMARRVLVSDASATFDNKAAIVGEGEELGAEMPEHCMDVLDRMTAHFFLEMHRVPRRDLCIITCGNPLV